MIASGPLSHVAAGPTGERLLAALASPSAETHRAGRRAPRFEAAIPGVAFVGDTVIDAVAGRPVDRLVISWPGDPSELADELRRRMRGNVATKRRYSAVQLHASEDPAVDVLIVPPPDAAQDGPLTDPVLSVRAARLLLDGTVRDGSGDLAARRLRLMNPEGFRRRPEALLHLARLAAREGWTVEPATYEAAVRARAEGAPGTAPVHHLGFAAAPLLASPEAPGALRFLQDLRPDAPLAPGIAVDDERLRSAMNAPQAERVDALLRALAPDASQRRIRDFRAGARI